MESLDKLVLRLSELEHEEPNPGDWTQTLSIRTPELHVSNVPALLVAMPNLRRYSITGSWITCSELSLLRHHCRHTLLELKMINISDVADDPENAPIRRLPLYQTFAALRVFSSLHTLELEVYNKFEHMFELPSNLATLEFPSLRVLSFRAITPKSFANLSWCRFCNLEKLTIGASEEQGSEDLDMLQAFLKNHLSPPSVTLSIPEAWLQTILREELILGSELILTGTALPPSDLLPPNVHSLHLHLNHEAEDLSSYWDFFSHLVDGPHHSLESINITFASSFFTWTCGTESETSAKFVGAFMSYSVQLAEHGIKVYDQRGKTVQMH
jgi:hypothetical protein